MDARNLRRGLRAIVEPAMRELQVPGVAVGVSHEGRDRCWGWGVTNVEFPLPVDGDTMFMIGSTTKTFTGTVIMRLVEDGKVRLNAPVVEYLPRFRLPDREVAKAVTVNHLVTHTSGWVGDYFDDVGRGNDAVARVVARMATRASQVTPLGQVWSYNNAGFYVLGRIIEVVTGKPYEDVVRELVCEPLGMERTMFFAEDVMAHKHALGHLRSQEGPVVARPWGVHRSAVAAGGMASTASDQLRYARFHMNGFDFPGEIRPPLSRKSVATMQAPRAEAGGLADAVGVTWLLERAGRRRVVGHGGSINGQMSAFKMVPALGLAVTVLTNGQWGALLANRVAEWVLAEVGGVRLTGPGSRRLSRRAAAAYEGRYRGDPGHIVVRFDNGGLVVHTELRAETIKEHPELPDQIPPPVRLTPTGRDRFAADNPVRRAEFLRGPDGVVEWIRWGGRVRPVIKK
ncbi:MAG: beta-lactamase family protein [Acidimicrobiaceae bacterium]|nr:beta-lactamase family protein [Acidimicrobiaceae bacterium]